MVAVPPHPGGLGGRPEMVYIYIYIYTSIVSDFISKFWRHRGLIDQGVFLRSSRWVAFMYRTNEEDLVWSCFELLLNFVFEFSRGQRSVCLRSKCACIRVSVYLLIVGSHQSSTWIFVWCLVGTAFHPLALGMFWFLLHFGTRTCRVMSQEFLVFIHNACVWAWNQLSDWSWCRQWKHVNTVRTRRSPVVWCGGIWWCGAGQVKEERVSRRVLSVY